MRRGVASLAGIALLAGCAVANDVADAVARDRAKRVVNTVVTDRFPRVNPAPVTDCIIDAASANEILRLATVGANGATPEVAQEVYDIARRPDSVQCIARNGLTLLGS